MNRDKELEEYIKEYRSIRFNTKKTYLLANISKLEPIFIEKLKLLIVEQMKRQQEDSASSVKYFYLCRLMSSGYTESYESILGMSNYNLYLDDYKSQFFWYSKPVYLDIDQDMIGAEKKLREKFIRLEDSELFYIRQKLLGDDWILLQKCFDMLIKKVVDLIIESPLRLDEELLILSGDYMDKLETIWCKNTREKKYG